MKRLFILIFCLFHLTFYSNAQNVYSDLSSFFDSISSLPVDSVISKTDALINASPDSLKGDVAGMAFNYFSEAPVMGLEAVALHIADSCFLNHRYKWPDSTTFPLLYAFSVFNRSSLIGMDSPDLNMETISGLRKSLREDAGHYKLVYFYDPQCSTCRRYSSAVADLARNYSGGRLSVFAINTGSDRGEWNRYVAEKFSDISTWKVDMYHLWDPEDSNDYHRKFGVMSTPTMLLLDSQNKVIGRRLDPDALSALLGVNNKEVKSVRKLIDDLFSSFNPVDTAVISQISHSLAVKSAEDTLMYRDFFYELFNYLRDSPLSSYQEGAALVASKYILGQPDYWSAEYLSKVNRALESYRQNPIGAKAPTLLLKDSCGVTVDVLKKPRAKYTLLVFHIVNCGDCRREFKVLDANAELLASRKVRVLCIYAGKDLKLWKDFIGRHNSGWEYYSDITRSSRMGEKYDIEFVPKLYLLDRRGKIIAKDIDAATLVEYLK